MANSESKKWATSGVDLLLELRPASKRRLRAGIEEALREAIRSGRLRQGTQLPPTRALAHDLGVSRGVLLEAYAQLAAEGWIAGRQGASTVVAIESSPDPVTAPVRAPSSLRFHFDLRPGRPDSSSFPRKEWLRALRRALAVAPNHAFDYGSPQGQVSLRNELAGYLARARGLRVEPQDVLITSGFTQGLGLVARSVASKGVRRIAMEVPSMALHRSIARAAGHELVLIPVDGEGMRVDELEGASGVGLVVLTPNRQHPSGVSLSPARRSRLLAWARANKSLVLEDDYDGEFRYDLRPLGPLQSLDPSVVVYAGTASKTLAPGVRIGWLAIPPQMRQDVIHQKTLADWHSSAFEQLAFAEMLRTAAYDRHIRKMRLVYRRRRDALLGALREANPSLTVSGADSGLILLIPLRDANVEAEAVDAAGRLGIGLDGLSTGGYYEQAGPAGILIGYGASPQHSFRSAVEALMSALGPFLARTA